MGSASISKDIVDQVRELASGGTGRDALATRFGISAWTVRRIVWGRTRGRIRPAALAERWEPLCMETDEWEAWLGSNRQLLYQADQAARPCVDCPLAHAAAMRLEDRCNGSPEHVHDEPPETDQEEP